MEREIEAEHAKVHRVQAVATAGTLPATTCAEIRFGDHLPLLEQGTEFMLWGVKYWNSRGWQTNLLKPSFPNIGTGEINFALLCARMNVYDAATQHIKRDSEGAIVAAWDAVHAPIRIELTAHEKLAVDFLKSQLVSCQIYSLHVFFKNKVITI